MHPRNSLSTSCRVEEVLALKFLSFEIFKSARVHDEVFLAKKKVRLPHVFSCTDKKVLHHDSINFCFSKLKLERWLCLRTRVMVSIPLQAKNSLDVNRMIVISFCARYSAKKSNSSFQSAKCVRECRNTLKSPARRGWHAITFSSTFFGLRTQCAVALGLTRPSQA